MFRYFKTVLILFAILMLESCGNSNPDANGSLVVGTPSTGTTSCGQQAVNAMITYTPPSLVTGAVPNGVVVNVSAYASNNSTIEPSFQTVTLGDSDSFTAYFYVTQKLSSGATDVQISASTGGLTSYAMVIIPAFTNSTGCSL